MKRIKLTSGEIGGKSLIFVRGLHGVPDFVMNKPAEFHDPDRWYWQEGRPKTDHQFFPAIALKDISFEVIEE